MEIVPAFRAFIDESNTPSFEVDLRDNQRPYVACCAIVPFEDQLSVLKAIPRSATSGDRLKSSSREMNDSKAASFIEAVLATETEIAIVGIDGGDSKNVELATKITQKANVFRKQSNRVSISKASAMYLLAARESLFRSLEAF